MKRRIEVAAHRGNVENAPENTMPAFTDAYGIDVDMIELDLRMTKDHEIVVIHDATVDRTSDGTGMVSDMTLAELKKLDFGVKYSEKFRGTRIPTFREFLDKHGNGVHHLGFQVGDKRDAIVGELSDMGYDLRTVGYYPGSSWTIVDTEDDLGVNLNIKPKA